MFFGDGTLTVWCNLGSGLGLEIEIVLGFSHLGLGNGPDAEQTLYQPKPAWGAHWVLAPRAPGADRWGPSRGMQT